MSTDGKVFKTDRFMFGVWQVKSRTESPHHRYFDSELEAWSHLLDRAMNERLEAQKELNRCDRNKSKAMKAIQRLMPR